MSVCEVCVLCGCMHLVEQVGCPVVKDTRHVSFVPTVHLCFGAVRKPRTCCRAKRAQDERDAEARRYHKDMSTLTVKVSALSAYSTLQQVLLNPAKRYHMTVQQLCSRSVSLQLLWIRICCCSGQSGLEWLSSMKMHHTAFVPYSVTAGCSLNGNTHRLLPVLYCL